jgi:diguanylate cyclase (GGDEF)-like protein
MTWDVAFPFVFWGAVPILGSHWQRRDRLSGAMAATFFASLAFGALWQRITWHEVALLGSYFAVIAVIPWVSRKALAQLQLDWSTRLEELQNIRDSRLKDLEAKRSQKANLARILDRLQDRFVLVQVLATRLEARDILGTLGNIWKNAPGVRACLLLQRRPNGNWENVYAHGMTTVDFWPAFLTEHPQLAQSGQIRHYMIPDKHPAFYKIIDRLRPPFLLVPIVWDQDVLALGYLEVAADEINQCAEELAVGRRLVSIGLRRAHLYDLMRQRSRHDALTGAYLRRVLLERLREAIQKSRRYKTPLFFSLMDVDHFKEINDRWGHLLGDRVLVHLVETIRRIAPPGVLLARYGGDEFAFILEMESLEEAVQWLDRVRSEIADFPLKTTQGPLLYTLSIGVSVYRTRTPSLEDLIQEADGALYQAKKEGRNRVAVWKHEE